MLRKTVTLDMESRMVDVANPERGVEVRVRADGSVLWVNVDGVCVCRVCGMVPGILSVVNEAEETRSVT